MAGKDEKVKKLIEFQDEVEACEKCFYKSGRKVLFGDGNIDAKIMSIGEAPSIVIPSGTNMPVFGNKSNPIYENFLEIIGETRKTVWTTNCVKCALVGLQAGESDKCKKFICREIEIISPEWVIIFGKVAKSTVLGAPLGYNQIMKTDKRKYLAMPHPMFASYGRDNLEMFLNLSKQVNTYLHVTGVPCQTVL